ncbi:MAG: 4'-phosphopantetheinyl transferase superfamily protein [Bacteroidetes bacterium]|jgi:4'-phosphopantetheinyl transferase|nr:4'-phosphopantetheinyl transferase superfamily protein [Bacteroidota bacterium]
MITCCYTEIKHKWSDRELADKLALLPENLRQEALRKRQWVDKQLSVCGKLLLLELLTEYNSKSSLADLKYNEYHRPCFDCRPDFNIAHSGNIVICAMTDAGQIGIDIEQIKQLDFADFTDFFTGNEWHYINGHANKFDGFYNFWTRKEAVLKAIGSGFHTPLNSVDVSGEELVYDDITYQIEPLNIHPEYKCHIATTAFPQNIELREMNF